MDTNLKACPFCGSYNVEISFGGTECELICMDCGVESSIFIFALMSREERSTAIFDIEKYNGYEPKYRNRAIKHLQDNWNNRPREQELEAENNNLKQELDFQKSFTGLKDTLGQPIMEGNIVHWSDGGDNLSLKERIETRWDRIALTELNKRQAQFRVIDSPSEEVRAYGMVFDFGSFIYKDTDRHLTIVANSEEEYRNKFKNAGECMAYVLKKHAELNQSTTESEV